MSRCHRTVDYTMIANTTSTTALPQGQTNSCMLPCTVVIDVSNAASSCSERSEAPALADKFLSTSMEHSTLTPSRPQSEYSPDTWAIEKQHLLAEAKQLAQQNQQLQKQIESVEFNFSNLQAAHTQLLDKWQLLQENVQLLQKCHQTLQHEHQVLQTVHVQQQFEHQQLKMDNQALQDSYNKLTQQHKQLQDEHQQSQDRNQNLEVSHKELQDQYNALQAEQQQSDAEWQQLHEHIHKHFEIHLPSTPGDTDGDNNSGAECQAPVWIWYKYRPEELPGDNVDNIISEFTQMIRGWRYYQNILTGPLGDVQQGGFGRSIPLPQPVMMTRAIALELEPSPGNSINDPEASMCP